MDKAKKTISKLVQSLVIVYTILFFVQGYLLFPSYMANSMLGKLRYPVEYNLENFREVELKTVDNIKIMGWVHSPKKNNPIILYLHGNASHIAARIPRYKEFVSAGYGIFALSYRGYGNSEGSPSEQGLYEDARTAIKWINENYESAKIIVYGESLGSGVAAQMATEYELYGIVMQSAYTSIDDMAAETYWFLPFIKHLNRNHFDSLSKIQNVHIPILFFHGNKDSVVPFAHGKQLFETANEPKKFVAVEGANHMNIPDELVVKAMKDFFTSNTGKNKK